METTHKPDAMPQDFLPSLKKLADSVHSIATTAEQAATAMPTAKEAYVSGVCTGGGGALIGVMILVAIARTIFGKKPA